MVFLNSAVRDWTTRTSDNPLPVRNSASEETGRIRQNIITIDI